MTQGSHLTSLLYVLYLEEPRGASLAPRRVVADVARGPQSANLPNQGSLPYLVTPMLPLL